MYALKGHLLILRIDNTCSCLFVGYTGTHIRLKKIWTVTSTPHPYKEGSYSTNIVWQGHHDLADVKPLDFMLTGSMWYREWQANNHYHYAIYTFEGTSPDFITWQCLLLSNCWEYNLYKSSATSHTDVYVKYAFWEKQLWKSAAIFHLYT